MAIGIMKEGFIKRFFKDKKRVKALIWVVVFSPLLLIFLCLLLVGIFADIPSFEELEDPKSPLATQIISQEGEVLRKFHI